MPRYAVRMKGTFTVYVEAPSEEDASALASEVKDIDYGDADHVEEGYVEEIDSDYAPYYAYDEEYRVVKHDQ